ncbi:MAG: TonB-dependent receptor [Cytophagales bacterium]|nr:TonB-dependent receptor [Cytophagales bacterium]MDW8384114.1 TonB-dependent receptor [Flammeovirgaceae bacterium]
MLQVIILISLFFGIQSLSAQSKSTALIGKEYSFSGHVFDGDSAKELWGATIILLGKENSFYAISDSLGSFSIHKIPQGDYKLVVTHVGYEPYEQIFHLHHESVYKKIILHQVACQLHEIEIKEERYAGELTQVTTSLGRDELTQKRGFGLGETLKNLPGITTINLGSAISKPMIHGLSGNRILIINGGLRQEGQQWGNDHAPEIDPFVADSIAVIKGASSVRYGPDALAGVILVEPRRLQKEQLIRSEIHLVGMTNGQQGTSSMLLEGFVYRFPSLQWRLQGTMSKAGNFHTPNYYLYNTGFEEKNFSYHVGYFPKNLGVEVFYSQFNTTLGIFSGAHIGNIEDLKYAISLQRPQTFDVFDYRIRRPMQRVEHELFRIKSWWKTSLGRLELLVGRQFNDRAELDVRRTAEQNSILYPDLHFKLTTHSTDFVFEHKPFLYHFSGAIGLNYLTQKNTWDGTRYFIPFYTLQNLGFFVHEKYKRCQHWEAEMGLRYDVRYLDVILPRTESEAPLYYSFRNLSFTSGIQFFIGNKATWKHHLGSAWRAPQANELFSNGIHHGAASFEVGNRNLKAERGFKYISMLQFTEKNLQFELSPYIQWIHNFIFLNPTGRFVQTVRGGFPLFEYQQVNAFWSGTDVSVSHSHKALTNICKFMYVRAENLFLRKPLPLVPSWRVSLKSNYRFFETKNYRLIAGVELLHVAKQNRWYIDFAPPPPAYQLLNVEFTFYFKQIRASLEIRNVFNTSYRDYLDRLRYYADEVGRNFIFRLHVPLNLLSPNA